MSTAEILNELPALTAEERRAIARRLKELSGGNQPAKRHQVSCSLAEFIQLWRSAPCDAEFAADLETVNRSE